jgi:ribonuclease HI
MPYYATYIGHIQNKVFDNWDECRAEIHKKPKYKKFATKEEAELFNKQGPFAREGGEVDLHVYTDGACKKNGREGAKAGIGVFFGERDPRNVSEALAGKCTNNIAEITAVLRALSIMKPELDKGKRCCIYTDSTYTLHCSAGYGQKCEKKGWPDDIPNRDLVRALYTLVKTYGSAVCFAHVAAHTEGQDPHSVGNRNADLLATASIQ